MFPEWQQQDLEAMLISNRNHVENTIDAIFQMDGPLRPKAPTPRSTPMRRQSEDYSQSHQRTPPPPPQRQGSFQGTFQQVPSGSARETYRGRRYHDASIYSNNTSLVRCPYISFHSLLNKLMRWL